MKGNYNDPDFIFDVESQNGQNCSKNLKNIKTANNIYLFVMLFLENNISIYLALQIYNLAK